jgi:hypothetical protein
MRRSSSTRPCSIRPWASWALPWTTTSPSVSPPQLRDVLDEVAAQHRRVVPLRILEGRRDDVLRHVVELVRELAGHLRPGRGKALVGHAPEEQGVGLERLVELELLALRPAVDLERPAAVLEVLAAARRLHDPVQRNELGYDDPSHLGLPRVVSW